MTENAFLYDDFSVSSDGTQFILRKRKIIKNAQDKKTIGKERWELVGYFITLEHVFNRMANLLCCKHIGDLSIAMTKIDELKLMVSNLNNLNNGI